VCPGPGSTCGRKRAVPFHPRSHTLLESRSPRRPRRRSRGRMRPANSSVGRTYFRVQGRDEPPRRSHRSPPGLRSSGVGDDDVGGQPRLSPGRGSDFHGNDFFSRAITSFGGAGGWRGPSPRKRVALARPRGLPPSRDFPARTAYFFLSFFFFFFSLSLSLSLSLSFILFYFISFYLIFFFFTARTAAFG
jgi:hypothetical protein